MFENRFCTYLHRFSVCKLEYLFIGSGEEVENHVKSNWTDRKTDGVTDRQILVRQTDGQDGQQVHLSFGLGKL